MHSVLVLEIEHVDAIFVSQVPPHPLYSEIIRDLTALHEDVPSNAGKFRSVEYRLELSGDEMAANGDCVDIGRNQVGEITSAVRSPILRKNLALARVQVEHSAFQILYLGIDALGLVAGRQQRWTKNTQQ